MSNVTLSPKSARAVKKYGLETCINAFRMNEAGEGASTIGGELDLTTRQADSAIDAGREYVTFTGKDYPTPKGDYPYLEEARFLIQRHITETNRTSRDLRQALKCIDEAREWFRTFDLRHGPRDR